MKVLPQLSLIKLRELRRQRDELRSTYNSLEHRVSNSTSTTDHILTLHRELQKIRLNQHLLHPEVLQLDGFLFQLERGMAPSDLVDFWKEKLSESLVQGKQQTEILSLVSELLQDWSEAPISSSFRPQQQQEKLEQFEQLCFSKSPSIPDNLLDDFVKNNAETWKSFVHSNQFFGEEGALQPVTTSELEQCLQSLQHNPRQSEQMRELALELLKDPEQSSEMASVLSILLQQYENWDWPQEGVAVEMKWFYLKWRPLCRWDDLHNLFLLIVGNRWYKHFRNFFLSNNLGHPNPEFRNGDYNSDNYWRGVVRQKFSFPEPFVMGQGYLREDNNLAVHSQHEELFSYLDFELQWARDFSPVRSFGLLQTDIQQFFPSFSHNLAFKILEVCGFSKSWVRFFQRFLSIPLKTSHGVRKATRGLPFEMTLSHLIAETALMVMREVVFAQSGVTPVGLLDDLYLVTQNPKELPSAWNALQKFAQKCGWKLHSTGCTTLSESSLPGLPSAPPTWGFLQLVGEEWTLHQTKYQTFRATTYELLDSDESLLKQVQQYNQNLNYLWHFLAPRTRSSRCHEELVEDALIRFHNPNELMLRGMEQRCMEQIHQRMGWEEQPSFYPTSLLFWPLSMGGLGLHQPMIFLGCLEPLREGTRPSRTNVYALGEWFQNQFVLRRFRAPAPQATGHSAQEEFVQQGNKALEGIQSGKGVYWQWILFTYGAQIRRIFGSFQFLFSDWLPTTLLRKYESVTSYPQLEEGAVQLHTTYYSEDDIPF